MNLADQIKCVERELALRLKVYPSRVERKKMKDEQANHEILAMRAVLETLRGLNECASMTAYCGEFKCKQSVNGCPLIDKKVNNENLRTG